MDFAFIFTPAHEAFDAAVEGHGFDIQRIDDQPRLVQLLEIGVDLVALDGDDHHFLAKVIALANFACRDEIDVGRLGFKMKQALGFELDDGRDLGDGHRR